MDLTRLRTFADDHHGLITRHAAAGFVSKTTWFPAVADGRLELVHRGVARLPGAAVTREQAIAAATLATGGLASHRSAASLWGVPRPEDDPIEVIVAARGRSPDVDGVVVHRPRDHKDLTPVRMRNISTTNVLRLLCDLGAVEPTAVGDAVGHVVSSGLASPGTRRGDHPPRPPGPPGVPAFRAALADWVVDGKPVDSVLEPAMRQLSRRTDCRPASSTPESAGSSSTS